MAYQTLRKLYYSAPENYAEIYKARFESEKSVKLKFFVAEKQAFFVQDVEVMSLAYEIAKLDKKVAILSASLPGVAKEQYSRKCLIDEIVLTNKIEGVHSSRKEIDEALEILRQQTSEKGRKQRFTGLVNKYMKLMTEEDISLNRCEDIRAIYDEMFLEEVISEDAKHAPDGKIFRKDPTSIYNSADKVIHTGVYPESKLIEAMECALEFLRDESVDELFRFCIFHYLIEYIHPFYDGNGRLGRFILSFHLSKTLEPLLSYRISEAVKEDISVYYKAFQTCNDPHNLADLTPFLLMMLNTIKNALIELQDSLSRKLDRWSKYEHKVSSFEGTEERDVRKLYSYLIQAALFSEKGISTTELTEQFRCSYHRLRKLIEQIRPELLVAEKKGKAKYYQINLIALDDIILNDALNEL